MRQRVCLLLLLIVFQLRLTESQPLLSNEEILKRGGYSLLPPSLSAALSADDPRIRIAAANKIADTRMPQAEQLIKRSMKAQQTPFLQIQLAGVLLKLNEPDGETALKSFCQDEKLDADLRVEAFRLLLMRNNRACDQEALRIVEEAKTGSAAISALNIFEGMSDEPQTRIRPFVLAERVAISQGDAAIRGAAANALGKQRTPEAAQTLAQALRSERDESVRSAIERALGPQSSRD